MRSWRQGTGRRLLWVREGGLSQGRGNREKELG